MKVKIEVSVKGTSIKQVMYTQAEDYEDLEELYEKLRYLLNNYNK